MNKLFKTEEIPPIKTKPCKGRGPARGNGCGKKDLCLNPLKKGLCDSCWTKWLLNTEEGQEYLQRNTIKAKKEVAHKKKKERTRQKRELMSVDAYRAKVIQPIINEIARLIDYGQPCIASGVKYGKFAGGHFTSVGANRLIALNLHNIHVQAYHSNGPQGGQPLEYLEGLRSTYGDEYAKKVQRLRSYKRPHKIAKWELEELYPKAVRVRNWLRRNQVERPPEARIRLRTLINQYFSIY